MSTLMSPPLMVVEAHCAALRVEPIAVALSRMPHGYIYLHVTVNDLTDAGDLARALHLDAHEDTSDNDVWSADALVDEHPVNLTVAYAPSLVDAF
jgi:hypothetical protein